MLKKTITYTDYDGRERTEDFYFNLNKAELTEMELSVKGGLAAMINKIISAEDNPTLIKIFKDLILKAYGEKSLDGKRFIKSQELRDSFQQCEAYSVLFMELATDADAASNFIRGLVPESISGELNASSNKSRIPEARIELYKSE